MSPRPYLGIAEELTARLAESVALKLRTLACAHTRDIIRISSLRASGGLCNQRNDARPLYQSVYTKLYACIGPSGDTRHSEAVGFVIQSDCNRLKRTTLGNGTKETSCLMWHLISTAPFDCDLELALIDATGVHAIPFPCQRILGGWIKAEMKTPVDAHPTHWRDWAKDT